MLLQERIKANGENQCYLLAIHVRYSIVFSSSSCCSLLAFSSLFWLPFFFHSRLTVIQSLERLSHRRWHKKTTVSTLSTPSRLWKASSCSTELDETLLMQIILSSCLTVHPSLHWSSLLSPSFQRPLSFSRQEIERSFRRNDHLDDNVRSKKLIDSTIT